MRQPAVTISRENGGGGNRTRVGGQPETANEQRKHHGWVYLISDGGWSYKIGHAHNPPKRLKLLQTGHPEELRLVAVREALAAWENNTAVEETSG